MQRRTLPTLLAGAALLLATACSDAVAPDATPRKAPTASPDLASYEAITTTLTKSLTLDPEGNDYTFGSFQLHVPAGAVCDPATSGYGPDTWDLPCSPITQPLRLSADVTFRDGRAWVDFHPNVRFVANDDPSTWVTLTTRRYPLELRFAQAIGTINSYALLYAPSTGSEPVDEARNDASVITHISLRDGYIWRRLRHFSGFTITAGFACTPTAETSCTAGGTVDVVPGVSTMTTAAP